MKKHDIAHDTLSFPFDDEDEFLGGPTQGDKPSIGGNSPDKRAWSFFILFYYLASCGLNFQTSKYND